MRVVVGGVEFGAAVVGDSVEVVRKLNKPSACAVRSLLWWDVASPLVGADFQVVRATGEKLFTGTVTDVEYEPLAWGAGAARQVRVVGASAEATAGTVGASLSGGVASAGAGNAAALLQAAGASAAAAYSADAVAQSVQLPAVEVAENASVAEALDAVASQSRLSYRVHDGVLTVQAVGAVEHDAAQAAGAAVTVGAPQVSASVVVKGGMEAQEYVSEYMVCDGTSALVPLGYGVGGWGGGGGCGGGGGVWGGGGGAGFVREECGEAGGVAGGEVPGGVGGGGGGHRGVGECDVRGGGDGKFGREDGDGAGGDAVGAGSGAGEDGGGELGGGGGADEGRDGAGGEGRGAGGAVAAGG